MRSLIPLCRALALVLGVALLLGPSTGSAALKCSVKVNPGNGVIQVSASGVSGPLLWGDRPATESNTFANAATCINTARGRAALCELGATSPTVTSEAITPPDLCTIFVKDGVGECAAFVRGCTPGLRTAAPDSRFGDNTGNATGGHGVACTLGDVYLTAGSVGGATLAAGQTIPISTNTALFSLLQFRFGGNGTTTFALPDLRSAAPNGLSYLICTSGIFPAGP